jgi:hypothetical protein
MRGKSARVVALRNHLSDAPGERRHEDRQHAHRQQGDVKFCERHQGVGQLGQIESEQQPGDDPCDDGRRMRDDSQDLTQQLIAFGESRSREPARWTAVTLTPRVRWRNRPAISVGPHMLEKTMQAKLVKFRRLQIAGEVIE